MTDTDNEQVTATSADTSPHKPAITLRALVIGSILTVIAAWIVPWNDWIMGNTYLYNNHAPLVVTLVLLIFGLAVNPLLGRWRLRAGEMVVIAGMLLALGGAASSGLARYLPTTIAGGVQVLAISPGLQSLYTEEGNYDVPRHMFLAIPKEGKIDSSDPEYAHLVDGYLYGHNTDAQRVAHRMQVSWRVLPEGSEHGPLEALSGKVAGSAREDGAMFLDLNDEQLGARMLGLRLGDAVSLPGGETLADPGHSTWAALSREHYGDEGFARLIARVNDAEEDAPPGTNVLLPRVAQVTALSSPGVPWYAWYQAALTWAPLLFAIYVSLIALAGIVRYQWIHNERLQYPVAQVTYALLDNPQGGQRFGEIFRCRAFWIAFAVSGGVLTWNGLYHCFGWVPLEITTMLNLQTVLVGSPWDFAPTGKALYAWQVWFSIVALTFMLSKDISLSVWLFFVLAQVTGMLLISNGFEVTKLDVGRASGGGMVVLCVLLLWIGRSYYWKVLCAAIGKCDQPAARQAVPYVWALLIGCGLTLAALMSLGVGLWGALLSVLFILGSMLVLARIVAEAGVPLIQLPTGAGFNEAMFTMLGFSLPAGALMPLALIGVTVMSDAREALMPYVVNADYLADRAKVPHRRFSTIMLATVCVGAVIACAAMIYHGYANGGLSSSTWAMRKMTGAIQQVADGIGATANPESAAIQASQRAREIWTYIFGAVMVAMLGGARLLWVSMPLHPIGFITMGSSMTSKIWFSVMLGWMLKVMVMRYGGARLYTQLKPACIGLIAGEALACAAFITVDLIAGSVFDINLPRYSALPG